MFTDHMVDKRFEFLIDLVNIIELLEGPAAIDAKIVDARHPLGAPPATPTG